MTNIESRYLMKSTKLLLLFLVTVIIVSSAVSASAVVIFITNSSFESPVLADSAFSAGHPANWTGVNHGGVSTLNPSSAQIPPANAGSAPDGANVLDIVRRNNQSPPDQTVTQTLAENFLVGITYTLSAWVAQRQGAGSAPFLGSLELLSGTTVLASVSLSPASISDAFTQKSVTYTATALENGLPITVQIRMPPQFQGGSRTMMVDNVELSDDQEPIAVEPATWGSTKLRYH